MLACFAIAAAAPFGAGAQVQSRTPAPKSSAKSTYGTPVPGVSEAAAMHDADIAAARKRNPPARSGGIKD